MWPQVMAAPPRYTHKDLVKMFGEPPAAIERHPDVARLLSRLRGLTLRDVHCAFLYQCHQESGVAALLDGTVAWSESMTLEAIRGHFGRALKQSEAWQLLKEKPRCDTPPDECQLRVAVYWQPDV